ncbi:MAG: methylated-DNA--[protein]-cysteine S-methyltransferase [Candidatus Izemoplasmatales bacterium]|jgi:O-6-methylguanine DNA methyltransferase|nr:methylated-DNA--[protein]-cysteine S-methyltransferase [Candidatus Izemoplasmatales bacterium]
MTEYVSQLSLGRLAFEVVDNKIIKISFTDKPETNAHYPEPVKLAIDEIDQYLRKTRREFSFPYELVAIGFQLEVLSALRNVPYGEKITYKQLAESIGSPRAFRAVGNACKKNPLPILIPCHRVIKSDGSIGGYAGGEEVKKHLLDLERDDHR